MARKTHNEKVHSKLLHFFYLKLNRKVVTVFKKKKKN